MSCMQWLTDRPRPLPAATPLARSVLRVNHLFAGSISSVRHFDHLGHTAHNSQKHHLQNRMLFGIFQKFNFNNVKRKQFVCFALKYTYLNTSVSGGASDLMVIPTSIDLKITYCFCKLKFGEEVISGELL